MQKEVFSAHSGRKLARIELMDVTAPIEIGDRYSFRIVKGFGNMWRKAFNEENMTIKKEDDEILLNIVAFPAEEEGIGILDMELLLPPRSKEETVKQKDSRSFVTRVRGYFSRPRA